MSSSNDKNNLIVDKKVGLTRFLTELKLLKN